jgi:parallel beta-helix repeat protein
MGLKPVVTNCSFVENTAFHGGGMLNSGSSPVVTDCSFEGNTVSYCGGGMYNTSSSPELLNCSFSGNTGNMGGGLFNIGGSSPEVTDCSFSGNTGNMGGGMYSVGSGTNPVVTDCGFAENTASFGGGMYNVNNSLPVVMNCSFSENSTTSSGAGIYNDESSPVVTSCSFTVNTASVNGGGISNISCFPEVMNCTFVQNSAVLGSGIYNNNSTAVVTNCSFAKNSASSCGGGIYNWICSPVIMNCSFSENSALSCGGGISNWNNSSPSVVNCILWGNAPQQIHNNDSGSNPDISFSCIQNGYAGDGNIVNNPLFVNASDDLQLSATSPCIDAGTLDGAPDTDILGISRPQGKGIDMGAYECIVVDTTAPVITLNGEASVTVECGGVYEDEGATAEDDIDGDLTEDIEVDNPVDAAVPGTYTVTYIVEDDAGNQGTATRTVVVEDETAPDISLNGLPSVKVECGGTYLEPGATASDICDGDLDSSAISWDTPVDSSVPDTYFVTYTVEDRAGNKGTATRTVIVEDTLAPVLELVGAAEMEIECGDTFVDLKATALDTCEGDLSGDVSADVVVDTSVAGVSFTITYSVADSEENEAEPLVRTVTIVDTTKPVLELLGDNPMLLDGALSYDEPGATAIDACGDVDYSGDIVITGEVNPLVKGNYEVTYTVVDAEGNESFATRLVVVTRELCDLLYDLEVDPNPACPGEPVTMRVVELPGSCAVGNVHYQWEKRPAGKADGFMAIPGADDHAEFVLASVDLDDNGEYRCTITDSMISRQTPIVMLTVDTGIPATGGLGLALAAVVTLVAGAVALRRKRD